jgi:hypothetical protein
MENKTTTPITSLLYTLIESPQGLLRTFFERVTSDAARSHALSASPSNASTARSHTARSRRLLPCQTTAEMLPRIRDGLALFAELDSLYSPSAKALMRLR